MFFGTIGTTPGQWFYGFKGKNERDTASVVCVYTHLTLTGKMFRGWSGCLNNQIGCYLYGAFYLVSSSIPVEDVLFEFSLRVGLSEMGRDKTLVNEINLEEKLE